MQTDRQIQSETARQTIPQHVLDRFESEWQQMRVNTPSAPQSGQRDTDKR